MSKNQHIRAFGSRISLLHIVVVSLSLMLTIGVWQYSKNQVQTRTEMRFNAATERAVGLIRDRMKKYEDALWSGVATIESHGGDMSYEEWQIFAETLEIEEKYPGINGIGIVHFVTQQSLDDYLTERRAERPGFAVYPAHEQDIFIPISFIEPEDINAAAVGLDLAHEVNRRTAALASRDTGSAQITGPIVLVQDVGHTAGFLFYAPYYRGAPPTRVEDRQTEALGMVYAPFVVRKLMEGLLAKDLRDIRFSISDNGEDIYGEHGTDDPLNDPQPMFSDEVNIELYGRTWTLDVRSNLAFREVNTYTQPTLILIGGLLIEALIISLLVLMSRANHRAVAYANTVTSELRAKSATLEKANAELEQFAYITSHDLKTPIRGIAGLTEMVQEDLEDYLKSPGANPEVGTNLDRILDRVGRMNALIKGVLEFSRIGTQSESEVSLVLSDAIEGLTSDFGIEPGQLVLSGDVEAVQFDTFNFRRILENLVGNAIKYHDGAKPLRIEVSVKDCGKRYRACVTDNGPGIEPRFHDKVFSVFQTLRDAGAPESTGIGLAIVKKTIEHHGGTITLASNAGKGAVFSFDWPKAAADMRDGAGEFRGVA